MGIASGMVIVHAAKLRVTMLVDGHPPRKLEWGIHRRYAFDYDSFENGDNRGERYSHISVAVCANSVPHGAFGF